MFCIYIKKGVLLYTEAGCNFLIKRKDQFKFVYVLALCRESEKFELGKNSVDYTVLCSLLCNVCSYSLLNPVSHMHNH